jgi:hypothetical protein
MPCNRSPIAGQVLWRRWESNQFGELENLWQDLRLPAISLKRLRSSSRRLPSNSGSKRRIPLGRGTLGAHAGTLKLAATASQHTSRPSQPSGRFAVVTWTPARNTRRSRGMRFLPAGNASAAPSETRRAAKPSRLPTSGMPRGEEERDRGEGAGPLPRPPGVALGVRPASSPTSAPPKPIFPPRAELPGGSRN